MNRPNARDLMENMDTVLRELDDTENSPDLTDQTEINLNTQEEQMLAVVLEDSEPNASEPEQVEDDSFAAATNQARDNDSTTATATNIPVQRIEALKVK